MTDPITVAVTAVAAVVAVAAGVASLPRAPALDGERWFKIVLITLLRGRTEAEGGEAADWERAVSRFVPYHPAGRFPEDKLSCPGAVVPADPPVAGEPDLLAELARLPDPVARYAHLFDGSPAGRVARLSDPAELGEAYDPAVVFGPGASWDDLADWGAGAGETFREALVRAGGRWVLVGDDGGAPPVLAALGEEVPSAVTLAVPAGGPFHDAALAEALAAIPADPAERLVIVAAGDAVHRVLRALAASAGLRDRVAAVVSVGGNLGGRADAGPPWDPGTIRDWMGAWFSDRTLDLELRRRLPCLAIQWLDPNHDPPGFAGLAVADARFPEPVRDPVAEPVLAPVDLGILPPHPDLPVDLVARALWTVVTAWIRREAAG